MELDLHRQILTAQNQLNSAIEESLAEFKNKIQLSIKQSLQIKQSPEVRREKIGVEKEHRMQQSTLTTMLLTQDYKTIYNMCLASFIPLTIVLVIENFSKHGQFLDFNTFSDCFRGADKIFIFWWFLAFIHYAVILLVKWIIEYKPSSYIWIPMYIIYILSLLLIPIQVVETYTPGFGAAMIIMIEGVRMMLKSHSYLRNKLLYCTENKYRNFNPEFIKKYNSNAQEKKLIMNLADISTQIQRFSYFFLAPTLIYRDNYTLNPRRNYFQLFFHFLNFVMCVYYAFMVYLISCKVVIEDLGKNLTFTNLIISVLKLMLPSVLFLVFGFFGFLHSWLNGWAQITRFPDRLFYLDWWNSIQFGSYYRKWNIVVHDWLYYYIYLDFQRFFGPNISKFTCKIATFLISAVIHEIVISYAVGFFYPVLFLLFIGPGLLLIQNQKRLGVITINFFFWIQMYIGTSLIFVFYLTEYYARQKIPADRIIEKWGIFSSLIPRTIYLI